MQLMMRENIGIIILTIMLFSVGGIELVLFQS